MQKKDIQALFLAGKCNEIPEEYLNPEDCTNLNAGLQAELKKAGCKCRHKGIRAKYLSLLDKVIKN